MDGGFDLPFQSGILLEAIGMEECKGGDAVVLGHPEVLQAEGAIDRMLHPQP